jgi:mitogen-activated protein kinase kinase kinase 1
MGPPRFAQDPSSSPSGSSRRRLDRRNASKNIGYDAANFCSYPPSPTPASLACSLDLVNSFRIGGSGDGGVRLLCHSLGLSGPDDFAIPLADWEAHKAVRLSSASARANPDAPTRDSPLRREGPAHSVDPELPAKEPQLDVLQSIRLDLKKVAGEGGIKGVRPPPVLKPPPSMAIPSVCRAGSTWDILASFAPDEQEHAPASKSGCAALERQEEEDDEGAAVVLTLEELRLGEMSEDFTGTSSLSTVNDDDTSSTTTESMFYISPNGRFRRKIRSWNRGMLLGSGSFGTVYEGISEYVPYKLDRFLICRFIMSCFGTTILEVTVFIN